MPRILSLLPAATEIVAALGATDELVGVTHECDHPPEVAARPRVTRSAIDPTLAPAEIDAAVGALAASGGDLFTLLEAEIAALAPEVVLTQALCEVCAVSEPAVHALAARLHPAPVVVTLGGTTFDAVLDDVRRVGAAVGRSREAEALVGSLGERVARVHRALKAARAPRPTVAVIEWTEPVYAAGHWVPEMVRRAGGVDALARPGEHSRPRPLAEVAAADPEVVVIAPCGYDVRRAAAEARTRLASEAWAWARGRRVWAMDSNALLSRPGPRLADGVETLAAIVAPRLFAPPPAAHALRIA